MQRARRALREGERGDGRPRSVARQRGLSCRVRGHQRTSLCTLRRHSRQEPTLNVDSHEDIQLEKRTLPNRPALVGLG